MTIIMGFPWQICMIYSLSQYILTGCPQSLGKLEPAQACCCFPNSLVGCLGLVPLRGWGWALCSLPHADLVDSERNIPQSVCSADIAIYAPSFPLGVETKSASLQEPWTVTSCVVLSFLTLPLPFRTETSSSVRVYCSVTKPWLLCWAVWEIVRSWNCSTLLLKSNPCYFWDEVPNAGSFS